MFQVRRAKKEDYISVRDFYYAVIDEMEHAEFSPGWERDIYPTQEFLIESIECDELYIGETDGEIVSCMVVNHAYNEGYKETQWSVDAKDSELLVIHALGVHPKFSGRGIAKQMVQKVIEIACENHIKAIRLDVLEGNVPAEKAYTKMGFQYIDTLQMFYEDTGWTKYKLFEYICLDRNLRYDADIIIKEAIQKVLPDEAVARALLEKEFGEGNIYVIAAGKAAWQMAKAAYDILQDKITAGVVCTKYGHVKEQIPQMQCFEGGHPVPDANSFVGTEAALQVVKSLKKEDTVLFLLSGGGSALFEKPLVSESELADITAQLLACGADIVEINTIRKRLSAVKGGKFAKLCEPAQVYSIVLSDILGDPLDMIASGPAYPDSSTCVEALKIAEKYQLKMSKTAWSLLQQETPKELKNVETVVTGSVKNLCKAAAESCEGLGYQPMILTDQLNCQAKEAGAFLAAIAKSHQDSEKSLAFIAGGETVVQLTGNGKGGRNQELALAAAEGIAELKNTAIFSVGSDGTDGPTDAAGGYCDGNTKRILEQAGSNIFDVLKDNNAYHALEKTGGLIVTGPTGTNVNDVAVLLIKR